MFKFTVDEKDYWVGYHDTLGYLIYAPYLQVSVDENFVILFSSVHKRNVKVKKDIIRTKLIHTDKVDMLVSYKVLKQFIFRISKYRKKPTISYFASLNSKGAVFHRENCGWLSNVGASKAIVFSSRESAIKQGYNPCKSCKP
ncbi:hypothetical protein [Pseudoalteromonas sp. MEBiC 03485]|uniref:hypothetical protein n=1 Tax=Pseudoalteromonas sp. MEBiC 03485 TaxID=2571103 RepID=UPI0010212A1A|nr:hypothetical protein [Pseudoalteromonas sp. MEBiC 03485]RZD22224.1 hypothetical protein EVU92_09210 [Pseudoalteromonas sp. MEBiC 03485]